MEAQVRVIKNFKARVVGLAWLGLAWLAWFGLLGLMAHYHSFPPAHVVIPEEKK